MRANLAAFFLFGSCAIIVVLAPAGYVGIEQLKLVAVTFPGVLVGFWLSGFVVNRLPFRGFVPIFLLVRALRGLWRLVAGFLASRGPFATAFTHGKITLTHSWSPSGQMGR